MPLPKFSLQFAFSWSVYFSNRTESYLIFGRSRPWSARIYNYKWPLKLLSLSLYSLVRIHAAPPACSNNMRNKVRTKSISVGRVKKIQIPTFSGEKQAYNTWRTAFNVCVDQQPISPELKLLQLRQYLSGPPFETVETYGHSASAYTTALKRLDQKYGGERRKTAVHMMALSNLPAIRVKGTAAELERFADLLQIAIINFEDAGRRDELTYGTFCTQMQQKLSATLLTDYFRWRSDHREPETVQTLLAWLTQEADFRTVAEETLQHSDGKGPRPTPVKNTQLQQSSRHPTQPTASSFFLSFLLNATKI